MATAAEVTDGTSATSGGADACDQETPPDNAGPEELSGRGGSSSVFSWAMHGTPLGCYANTGNAFTARVMVHDFAVRADFAPSGNAPRVDGPPVRFRLGGRFMTGRAFTLAEPEPDQQADCDEPEQPCVLFYKPHETAPTPGAETVTAELATG